MELEGHKYQNCGEENHTESNFAAAVGASNRFEALLKSIAVPFSLLPTVANGDPGKGIMYKLSLYSTPGEVKGWSYLRS